jgi:hypothetical protein
LPRCRSKKINVWKELEILYYDKINVETHGIVNYI